MTAIFLIVGGHPGPDQRAIGASVSSSGIAGITAHSYQPFCSTA
jgi:hypothetical protein